MPSCDIQGKLYRKVDTVEKSQSFSAREFVLEVNDNNYVQLLKFQLTQDRCGLLDNFEEGRDIKVHFDLRGREWNGKFFTNLNAWKIEMPQPPMDDAGFPKEEDFVFNDDPHSDQMNQIF